MVEHAVIRLHVMSIRSSEKNSDSIYELDEFVIKCHARIEDEISFLRLRKAYQLLTKRDLNNLKTRGRSQAHSKDIGTDQNSDRKRRQ
jgi:hypothetical protein